MRVRSFFWFVLAATCIGVLLLALFVRLDVPVRMQLTLNQQELSQQVQVEQKETILTLHLSDPHGMPIDDAQAFSSMNMTTMDMGETQTPLRSLGQGKYMAHLQWTMAGSWRITVNVHADGFKASQQSIVVNVV